MSRDHTAAGKGSAVLTGEPEGSSDTFTIHGVAIGSGDVTVGSSGVRKIWPEDELREAASTLQGKPLVKDHENSVDGVIGTVTRTKFERGTGVLYEAEITEQFKDVAQKIADGLLEVSVRAYHAPTEELEDDDELDAKVVEDIVFDNLAVVPQGAAPSNSAQAGSAATMSQNIPDLSAAELRAAFDEEELAFHGEALDEIESYASVEDHSMDDPISSLVEWSDSEHVSDAADAYVEAVDDASMDSSVSALQSWIESDMDDDEESDDPHPEDVDIEESAMVNGLEVNGTVMWGDDNMGVISGFEEDDGDLVVVVDVMEKDDDGPFRKTGESVRRPLHAVGSEASADRDGTIEELKTVAGVTFEGTSGGKLDESAIPNDDYESHYLYPSDTKSDSSYPVVDAEGNLRAGNVEAAFSLGARGGVDESDLHSKLESLNDEFEDPPIDPENFEGDSEESGAGSSTDSGTDTETLHEYTLARIVDDSSEGYKTGTIDSDTDTHHTNMEIDYRNVDGDELDESYVAVDQDELNAVVEKAERAEELDSRLDEMNDTLSTLSEKTEILDEVDEDDLEALRDREDPVVKEREEYKEQMDAVDEVGGVFAELIAEEDSVFTAEELAELHSPLALKQKYEEMLGDDESIVDQLSGSDPEPEGEDVDEDELGGGGDAGAEEKREAFAGQLADELESSGHATQAEEIRNGRRPEMVDEYAEKLGVDLE